MTVAFEQAIRTPDSGYDHDPGAEQERVFGGRHEIAKISVDHLVTLPQVRGGENPELPRLIESIRANDLINPINVARMDEAKLIDYIDFVNSTWRTNVSFDDYRNLSQEDEDGNVFYNLVIAGHTRAEAMRRIQQQDGLRYKVWAKIHDVKDHADIVSIQLDENIHSKPQPERRAIGIVETFLYGRENGLWKTKADFVRQAGNKFSTDILNDALGFAQLPVTVQELVFNGEIPYGTAVTLGGASDTTMQYAQWLVDNAKPVPGKKAKTVDEVYAERTALHLATIFNSKLTVSKTKVFIKDRKDQMERDMGIVGESADQPTLFLIPPEERAQAYLRQLERDLKYAFAEMAQSSIDKVLGVKRICEELGGGDILEEVEEELAKRRGALGHFATKQALELAS